MSFNVKMRNTKYDVNILERLDLGDESADDAPLDDLMSYFVEQKSFSKFVDFRKKLIIAQARKGNGKSAILQWIFYKASENKDNLVIKCRGAELVRSRFALSPLPDSTPNTLIHDWMSRICTLINRELAKKINFALTDNEITLVETAELDGFKQKNIIGALLDRFSLKLNKGSVELAPEKQRIQNEIETLKRQKDFKAIIIIDDLDATFQNKPEECLSLSTFFSACRYLIQDFPGIVIRTSLRTDVWPMIRPLDEALDKVEQYIHEIHWSENDFVQLINKRICHSLNLETESNALDYVFEKSINWGRKTVFNYVVLYTLSYERPRWGIQLCKLALEHALEKNHDIISQNDIEFAWVKYGKLRIADLESEHRHQCSKIGAVVQAFRGQPAQMNREELLNFISSRIANRDAICIDGRDTRKALDIAFFLYRIGFIVARSHDENFYYHYSFEEFSSLLSSKISKDTDMEWEIHPCYRKALDIKSLNAAQRESSPRI